MSGNKRKNIPKKDVEVVEEPVAARVVAIPKDPPPTAANAAPAARPKSERIGDILRQSRLDKNDDLYLIAEYLCIKPAFLIALENSRYDEFPADAYVIGFLRTYANFLGVDGKDAVDRYRYEMAGRRKKPILSMPTPVSEGRAPTGIIMVAATIAILLVYALWYGISSANRTEVNVPPPLPTTVQAVPATSDSSSGAAGLTAPMSGSSTTTNTAASAPPSAVTPPASTTATSPNPLTPPAGIPVTGDPTPIVPKEEALGKNVTPPADATAKTDPTAKDAAKDNGKDAGGKTAYGDPNVVARIIIRATQSSWVMVTDQAGKAVFDHVLKPGDTYKVPNKPGLFLTTGNGSGIVLSLDGNDLPKVANGAPHVVRNINLDADHLMDQSSSTEH